MRERRAIMRTSARRDFIKQSLALAGTAGVLASGLAPLARAQTARPFRRPGRWADSFIFERKPFTWPGNKTLPVCAAPNFHARNSHSPFHLQTPPTTPRDIRGEGGVRYCGDWTAAAQPFPMKVKSGKLFGIPSCMEINDTGLFMRKGYTGEPSYRTVMDQFEQLLADSRKQPRVLGIPLHPMITGQPLRIKYLQRTLADIKKSDRVWFATGSEIIDAYQKATATG